MIRQRRFLLVVLCAILAPAPVGADVVTLVTSKDNTLYENASGGVSNGAGEFFFSGITACAVNMVERLANNDNIALEWMDVGVESYRDSDADHGDLSLYDAIRIKFEMWGVDDEDAHNLVETWKKR